MYTHLEEANMNTNVQLNDDDVLSYVHNKRASIVESLTASGVPTDLDTVKVLLTALKDMDYTALSKKKIKAEERNSDLQSQSAALIAKILLTSSNKVNVSNIHIVTPTLPNTIPPPILVEGELDIIPCEMTYDGFINDFIEKD